MSTKHVRNAADLARFKCGLGIKCRACGRRAEMSGYEVAKVGGTRDFRTIARRLTCSGCGAKDPELSIASPPPPR